MERTDHRHLGTWLLEQFVEEWIDTMLPMLARCLKIDKWEDVIHELGRHEPLVFVLQPHWKLNGRLPKKTQPSPRLLSASTRTDLAACCYGSHVASRTCETCLEVHCLLNGGTWCQHVLQILLWKGIQSYQPSKKLYVFARYQ